MTEARFFLKISSVDVPLLRKSTAAFLSYQPVYTLLHASFEIHYGFNLCQKYFSPYESLMSAQLVSWCHVHLVVYLLAVYSSFLIMQESYSVWPGSILKLYIDIFYFLKRKIIYLKLLIRESVV